MIVIHNTFTGRSLAFREWEVRTWEAVEYKLVYHNSGEVKTSVLKLDNGMDVFLTADNTALLQPHMDSPQQDLFGNKYWGQITLTQGSF